MRVCSIGAGAVGGTVAARLVGSGVDLVVVDTNAEHAACLSDPGLRVDDDVVPLTVVPSPPTDTDLVLLAVRAGATEAALTGIPAAAHVVSMQNGLQEDRIAGVVGAERTIGCVVGFGATWMAPGHVEVTGQGDLTLGRLDGSTDDVLEATAQMLALAFPTRITRNIAGALWAKMLVNSMTVLGALTGSLTGELLATPQRRKLVAQVVAEGVDVAVTDGVRLRSVFGQVDPELVATRTDGWIETLDAALQGVAESFGQVKSVTLRDFELGRSTEIDAVTGEIVRRGLALGVATPLSAKVYERLKEIEAGQRTPGPTNLEGLL